MTISLKRAALAKCHNCCGGYIDGRVDCQVTSCPLYSWMPFAELEPRIEWAENNPLRVGDQKIVKRQLTDEQKSELRDRLAKHAKREKA